VIDRDLLKIYLKNNFCFSPPNTHSYFEAFFTFKVTRMMTTPLPFDADDRETLG